jgi:hypothetical protein
VSTRTGGRVTWEGWFSIELPRGWAWEQAEGGVITLFARRDGVGALTVSLAHRRERQAPSEAEAVRLAHDTARDFGWRIPPEQVKTLALGGKPAATFSVVEAGAEPRFWQVWHVLDDTRAAFVTYSSEAADQGLEASKRAAILTSFRWEPTLPPEV